MRAMVKTESGALYLVDGDKVMGGSKNLKDGKLVLPVRLNHSMLMLTPERAHHNPHFKNPAVMSTPVVEIEPIISMSELRRLKTQIGVD